MSNDPIANVYRLQAWMRRTQEDPSEAAHVTRKARRVTTILPPWWVRHRPRVAHILQESPVCSHIESRQPLELSTYERATHTKLR
jgi:hypothetical protein